MKKKSGIQVNRLFERFSDESNVCQGSGRTVVEEKAFTKEMRKCLEASMKIALKRRKGASCGGVRKG